MDQSHAVWQQRDACDLRGRRDLRPHRIDSGWVHVNQIEDAIDVQRSETCGGADENEVVCRNHRTRTSAKAQPQIENGNDSPAHVDDAFDDVRSIGQGRDGDGADDLRDRVGPHGVLNVVDEE